MPPDPRTHACEFVAEGARTLLTGQATIRAARTDDLASLVEIERAAAETFRSLSMDFVADDDPGSIEELRPYADDGRAFVAVDRDDRPLGYLLVDVVDGAAHIEQVSVHPDQARRGLGRALIERAAALARTRGLPAMTLTTYIDVPWNGPYYERIGFRYLAHDDETPGLRAIRDRERAAGLEVWPRTSMRRDLDGAERLARQSERARSELVTRFGAAMPESSDGESRDLVLRDASVGERAALELLQRRSSDLWEQYREQLAAHPDAIELPEAFIADGWVRVVVGDDEVPLGFSVVIPREDGTYELDGLFVEPTQMQQGLGRRLVEDACERARASGALRLDVVAGPAVGFYEKLGFHVVGIAETRFGRAVRMRRLL